MPTFRQIDQIQQLMKCKEQIRNVGIIAHIDHGKTTLADSLLAGAGLLSPQMAGTARVLDFLQEEQKRKITIKTANISLLFEKGESNYLINLVDTPGHVDFTGKVTRALRTLDGAIVVVDAVEEIMPQTEILTRQALQERVCPVLFINKIDRLISELQLNAKQIEEKLNHIIDSFNNLLDLYGEEPFKTKWKVNPAMDQVAFGSALHGWGFTLSIAKQKGVKFTDIIEAYNKAKHEELQNKLPVFDAVFGMTIQNLPSAKQAQVYRIERIWDGTIKSDAGMAMVDCNDKGPSIMCVTNVLTEADGSAIATGRVFSGTVKRGDTLHLVEALGEVTVSHVLVGMGAFHEKVNQISAGNMAVLALPTLVRAGETLVDEAHKTGMVPFESVTYVSEPVVTVAIEPKDPKNLPFLVQAMERLTVEDPNLAVEANRETGEYLMSGMGELHLEVSMNELRSKIPDVRFNESPPRAIYRETTTAQGRASTAISPNGKNRFVMQVEPIEEDMTAAGVLPVIDESGNILSMDEHRNVLLDCSGKTEDLEQEILEAVIAGFEFACKAGPLCGEPVRHTRVHLLDFQTSEDVNLRSAAEIMHAVGKAIFASFLTAKPILLEPYYKTVMSTPAEFTAECQRIISTRRGKIRYFEQKGFLTVITAHIPVSETFGISKELRSATSGRAFWQNIIDHWEQIPQKLAAKVIPENRRRKGLAPEIPSASRFSEEA